MCHIAVIVVVKSLGRMESSVCFRHAQIASQVEAVGLQSSEQQKP